MITLAAPSWHQDFKPKYAPIATGWLLRHVWLLNMCINVLHSNLWLPAQAGERPWRSETIGVAARKMSEYFCARRHPQVGFLTVYYKMDILKLIMQSGFWFFKLLRAPRSLFLFYKLGLKNGWKEPLKTVEKFPGSPFCKLSQIFFWIKMPGLLLNGWLQPHPLTRRGIFFEICSTYLT